MSKDVIESLLAEYDMSNSAFAKDLREALAEQQPPVQQEPATKDVVIDNMGKPFTVKAYVDPQPAQQEFVSPGGGYVPAIPAQQEPVAQVHPNHLKPSTGGKPWCREVLLYSGGHEGDLLGDKNYRVKLYTSPQPAQQEPVYVQTRHKQYPGFSEWGALLDPTHRNSKWAEGVEMRLLYTSPPAQRTWVGLTDEEVWDLWNSYTEEPFPEWFVDFKRAYKVLEAKLKEKNT